MTRKALSTLATGLLFALALLPVRAMADDFDFMTTDGPLHLRVFADGQVHGGYPKLRGSVRGHVDEDGGIHGIWLQPTSDHPCNEMRDGTYAWGSFYLRDPFRHHPAGWWGYCGEQPRRDWELERD